MTVLSNILLGVSALTYLAVNFEIFAKPLPRGGDSAVGYFWMILLGYGVFFGILAVVSAIIGSKGGFSWISSSGKIQFLAVAISLLLMALAIFFSVTWRSEPEMPFRGFFQTLGWVIPLVVPLLALLSLAMLSNFETDFQNKPKTLLTTAVLLSLIPVASTLVLFLRKSAENSQLQAKEQQSRLEKNDLDSIVQIDSCDVSTHFVNLLLYTDRYKSAAVRERALDKIKSHPTWQNELISLLNTPNAAEVFTYLSSNPVENKRDFEKPLLRGIEIYGAQVSQKLKAITDPSAAYPELFSWEIERMLLSVDNVASNPSDYRPSIEALRAHFSEKGNIPAISKLQCIRMLDSWLKSKR